MPRPPRPAPDHDRLRGTAATDYAAARGLRVYLDGRAIDPASDAARSSRVYLDVPQLADVAGGQRERARLAACAACGAAAGARCRDGDEEIAGVHAARWRTYRASAKRGRPPSAEGPGVEVRFRVPQRAAQAAARRGIEELNGYAREVLLRDLEAGGGGKE